MPKENFAFVPVVNAMCIHVKSIQSCLTLCNPLDYSLPGSSVQGIVQARILEWVAVSFSRRSSTKRNAYYTVLPKINAPSSIVWTPLQVGRLLSYKALSFRVELHCETSFLQAEIFISPSRQWPWLCPLELPRTKLVVSWQTLWNI